MIVPPLASAIHQTYSAIAKPQATGMLMPQTPTPFANSHDTAISNRQNRTKPKLNPVHYHRGALGFRIGTLISVLSESRLTPGLMIGGSPGGAVATVMLLLLLSSDYGYAPARDSWCAAMYSAPPT